MLSVVAVAVFVARSCPLFHSTCRVNSTVAYALGHVESTNKHEIVDFELTVPVHDLDETVTYPDHVMRSQCE